MDRIEYFICKEFGSRVRNLRKRCGLSQELLALKAGIDRTYIGRIERGKANPTLITIIKISAALGVNPQALFPDSSKNGQQKERM
ncbi:MAG: XRE family transcriptional regulator [Chloroflexi bacterium]|nr:MAG: XRE family transcriptional regulator [Chloroflexota bacterium]